MWQGPRLPEEISASVTDQADVIQTFAASSDELSRLADTLEATVKKFHL